MKKAKQKFAEKSDKQRNFLKEKQSIEEKKVDVSLRKKNKVAIVGYAPSSRMLAPFGDQDFEIWGVNELYKIVPRVDVLFELHNRKWFNSKARNPEHLKWLQTTKIPVFTLEAYPDIPTSVKFPIDEIKKFFSPYEAYFTNSISYMIALAIMLDYEEIHIYGVDMATEEEYQAQRPSVEFYLGIAAGIYMATKRCFVYIPPQCDLIKTLFQYGYEDDNQTAAILKIKSRKQELQMRINEFANQMRMAENNMSAMRGAYDDTVYFERCLLGTANQIHKLEENDGKET